METPKAPSLIQRAIAEKFGWGGQTKLARELSARGKPCTPQAVQKWCATGHVPDDRIAATEEILGVPIREDQPEAA